jgi:hypothetical protein
VEIDGEPFLVRVSNDKEICKRFLATENMTKVFEHYEPAIKIRGLTSPFSLMHKRCQGLHSAYKDIVKHAVYLIAYVFSTNISCMQRNSRC